MYSKNISPSTRILRRVVGAITLPALSLVFLLTGLVANNVQAHHQAARPQVNLTAPALQGIVTPTPTLVISPSTSFSLSLASLGYGEAVLQSPRGSARIAFRIPQNWSITSDGLLDLDLSYNFEQLTSTDVPLSFGNLTVTLDGQDLTIFRVTQSSLDNYRLQVPLPASIINESERRQHVIGLRFDANILCETPHEATLIIHPTSTISLDYTKRPLELDLSQYPQPFYEPDFTSGDAVRFVLPTQPNDSLASDVVAMTAKLGDLTNARLVISATTDLDYGQPIPSNMLPTEHLFVLGKPQDNRFLPLLNEAVDLPVSLHRQQLGLRTQAPTTVAPAETFTYVYTVTNATDQPANLSVISVLPNYIELIECTPKCAKHNREKVITWDNNRLASKEILSLAVTLKATDTLTGTTLENTITVNEAILGPVNAATLITKVGPDLSGPTSKISAVDKEDYFFVYKGQAVASADGIVQEILSPWNKNQAILVITGLDDDAVRKASQAMSSESRFPGMKGQVALVREALRPEEITDDPKPILEVTFDELGYPDQVLRGDAAQHVDFFFDVPLGWQLTEDASLDFYFNHTQLIKFENSGVTVLFNRKPIASMALSPETANGGHLHVKLTDVEIQTLRPNRITVQVNMASPPSAQCVDAESEQAWFVINKNSTIFLAHKAGPNLQLNLVNYPYPFNAPSTLSKLMLALPSSPTNEEWEIALDLAASLGSGARGKTLVPVADIGGDLSFEVLANYNIIAIGRPSRNPTIQRVNAELPQPFVLGSDEIDQRLDDVVFRLPPDLELGYMQLISSPWNPVNAFLALTGTTDDSVQLAVRTLNERRRVPGNLAMVREDQVNSLDTRTLTNHGVAMAVATAVPELTPVTPKVKSTTTPALDTVTSSSTSPDSEPIADLAPTAEQLSTQADRPAWLMPLIGVNGVLIVAIVAFGFLRSRNRA